MFWQFIRTYNRHFGNKRKPYTRPYERILMVLRNRRWKDLLMDPTHRLPLPEWRLETVLSALRAKRSVHSGYHGNFSSTVQMEDISTIRTPISTTLLKEGSQILPLSLKNHESSSFKLFLASNFFQWLDLDFGMLSILHLFALFSCRYHSFCIVLYINIYIAFLSSHVVSQSE